MPKTRMLFCTVKRSAGAKLEPGRNGSSKDTPLVSARKPKLWAFSVYFAGASSFTLVWKTACQSRPCFFHTEPQ